MMKPASIAWGAPAILLALAVLPFPYGYYQFVRLATCSAAIYLVYYEWSAPSPSVIWGAILVGVAILFNPIYPIHLNKSTWQPIDIGTSALLATHWWTRGRASFRKISFDDETAVDQSILSSRSQPYRRRIGGIFTAVVLLAPISALILVLLYEAAQQFRINGIIGGACTFSTLLIGPAAMGLMLGGFLLAIGLAFFAFALIAEFSRKQFVVGARKVLRDNYHLVWVAILTAICWFFGYIIFPFCLSLRPI